jgi:hypothetical protein
MIVLDYGAKIYWQYFLFSNNCYTGRKKNEILLNYILKKNVSQQFIP